MSKLWVAIIVIVAVAGGVWWTKNGGSVSIPSSHTSASPTAVANASKAPVAPSVKQTTSPVPTQPALSYTQLVQQYGSNRIQFDASCQAQPKASVFKNGTSILLDNRSDQARTVVVNGTSYALGAYGYQVITLSSSSVPKTISVNCNNLVNVGTYQLQANISGQ